MSDGRLFGAPKAPSTFSGAKHKAPRGYVAGIGRGASGFTTQSDIGPAHTAAGNRGFDAGKVFGAAPKGYVAGRGRGATALSKEERQAAKAGKAVDKGDYSSTNYDEFSGFAGNLFADAAYDKDDAEADAIYRAVDEKMASRRSHKIGRAHV